MEDRCDMCDMCKKGKWLITVTEYGEEKYTSQCSKSFSPESYECDEFAPIDENDEKVD